MGDGKISLKRISLLLAIVLLPAAALYGAIIARWFLFLLWKELLLICILISTYFYLNARGLLDRVCFSAIVSLSFAILNPGTIFLLRFAGLHIRSLPPHFAFLYGIVAVVAGHKALRRIKRSPVPLRGRTAAVLGLVLGYALIIGSIVFLMWLGHVISGMSPV